MDMFASKPAHGITYAQYAYLRILSGASTMLPERKAQFANLDNESYEWLVKRGLVEGDYRHARITPAGIQASSS